jgi:ubiquinone/menaquinone biosynthesis C-methylase UbiE
MARTGLTPPPNYSSLARVYAPLEWLSFGRALARRRTCFIADPRIAHARHALIFGDGDGRFTAALLERYPTLAITAVDASAAMLGELERRVRMQSPSARLDLHCADVRSWSIPDVEYDLVASHFFFDCFTTRELTNLVSRVAPKLSPNAHWLVSDFAIPNHVFWSSFAKVLVRLLYFAFGLLTRTRLTHLPAHQPALKSASFELADEQTALGGTLRSELWSKKP